MSAGVSPPESTSEPEPPPVDRAAAREPFVAVLVWVVPFVAAMVFVAILKPPTAVQTKYLFTLVALIVPVAIAWFVSRTSVRSTTFGAALAAAFPPLLIMLGLTGTRWYFSGLVGDQSYRLEYVTRFAHSPALHDYTYAGKAAFYSPGWFWLAGQAGRLTDTPGWAVYKPAAIFTIWLAGIATFYAWRATVSPRRAALFTVVTCLALPFATAEWFGNETFLNSALYEPYAWILLAPMPAVIAWYAGAHGPFNRRRAVLLGLALGAAAWFYLAYGGLAAVTIAGLAATAASAERRARIMEALVAFGVGFAVTIPWSVPFAIGWLTNGRPTALGATYFNDSSFGSISLTLTPSPILAVALLGVVALIAGYPRSSTTRGLRTLGVVLVAAALAQAFLGRNGQGVLFHRMTIAVGLVAVLAGANLGAEIWVLTRDRVRAYVDRPQNIVFGVLAVLLVIAGSGHANEIISSVLTQSAKNEAYANGTMPRAADDRTPRQLSVDAFQKAIANTTGISDPEKIRLLTSSQPLLAEVAYNGYEQWWELYANPLADYKKRRTYIESLAALTDPKQLVAALHEKNGPNAFALHVDNGRWTYSSQTFDPKTSGVSTWSVGFDPKAFDDPCFVKEAVADWMVVALKC